MERKNAWKKYSDEDKNNVFTFADEYKTFISECKTERECVKKAVELAKEEDLIFLCGHYEGIDERVLEEIVTDYISIGDYVLTGGELPAMVMIDTISRLVPGVLNNGESAQTESHSDGLLEYPQYSRPEVWHEKTVPDVLLSGHHANIEKWRHEQALLRTQQRRPDMYSAYMEAHPPLPPKRRRRKSANAVNKEENTEIMEIIP